MNNSGGLVVQEAKLLVCFRFASANDDVISLSEFLQTTSYSMMRWCRVRTGNRTHSNPLFPGSLGENFVQNSTTKSTGSTSTIVYQQQLSFSRPSVHLSHLFPCVSLTSKLFSAQKQLCCRLTEKNYVHFSTNYLPHSSQGKTAAEIFQLSLQRLSFETGPCAVKLKSFKDLHG